MVNVNPPDPQTPEGDDLHSLALQLFGVFAHTQEMIMYVPTFHLRKTSPGLGLLIAERYLDNVSDADRLRWFGAVVADSGVPGVPVDAIVTVFNQAKDVRDHIAHSPGSTAIWTGQEWRLQVSSWNKPKLAKRAAKVPALTRAELERQVDRLLWVGKWVGWVLVEGGYTGAIDMQGKAVSIAQPPEKPLA